MELHTAQKVAASHPDYRLIFHILKENTPEIGVFVSVFGPETLIFRGTSWRWSWSAKVLQDHHTTPNPSLSASLACHSASGAAKPYVLQTWWKGVVLAQKCIGDPRSITTQRRQGPGGGGESVL